MKTSKSITTIIEKWQLTIWIISSLLLCSIIFLFVSSVPTRIFSSIIWLAVSFYISRYFCRASTTFEFNQDILIISLYCKTLNINETFEIDITQIRGFEINEVTRGNRALILYFVNFKHLKFSLTKISDELVIKKKLTEELSLIDKNSNPYFKSFSTAYWFALKRTLLFMVINLLLCGTLIWQHKMIQLSPFKTGIVITVLSIALWIFTVKRPIKRKYFRFGAFYWLSNFFIYLSPLLLFPIYFLHVQYKEELIRLKNPYQIFNRISATLYEFDTVNYNPNEVIVSSYFFASTTGRSLKQSVNHYIATPITYNQPITTNGIYEIWLTKHFSQSISKQGGYNIKNEKALTYQYTARNKFIQLLTNKPIFYKATFNDNQAYQTVRKSQSSAKYNILLEPHWESLDEYREDLRNRMIYFLGAILLANLIGCMLIASAR